MTVSALVQRQIGCLTAGRGEAKVALQAQEAVGGEAGFVRDDAGQFKHMDWVAVVVVNGVSDADDNISDGIGQHCSIRENRKLGLKRPIDGQKIIAV